MYININDNLIFEELNGIGSILSSISSQTSQTRLPDNKESLIHFNKRKNEITIYLSLFLKFPSRGTGKIIADFLNYYLARHEENYCSSSSSFVFNKIECEPQFLEILHIVMNKSNRFTFQNEERIVVIDIIRDYFVNYE